MQIRAETDEVLEKLKNYFNASSKAEVWRKALALLELAAETREKGGHVAVVDKDERVYKVLL